MGPAFIYWCSVTIYSNHGSTCPDWCPYQPATILNAPEIEIKNVCVLCFCCKCRKHKAGMRRFAFFMIHVLGYKMFKAALQYTTCYSLIHVKTAEDINNCSYVVKFTGCLVKVSAIKKTVLRDSLFYLCKTG
jgi:hypothetical protein